MKVRNLLPVLCIGCCLCAVADESAQETPVMSKPTATDSLELEATSVRGNQELPKVLSIVPWKDALPGDPGNEPVGRLVDEVLSPVDRDVFLRQERYFEQLYSSPEAGQ